jgi:hypothetical protein
VAKTLYQITKCNQTFTANNISIYKHIPLIINFNKKGLTYKKMIEKNLYGM